MFPTLSVCNLNQIEASTMMELGVYGDANLTGILLKEFILGNKENLTENATKLVDTIKHILFNYSGAEDFAHFASQPCWNLFLSIKFQDFSGIFNENIDTDSNFTLIAFRTICKR